MVAAVVTSTCVPEVMGVVGEGLLLTTQLSRLVHSKGHLVFVGFCFEFHQIG